MVDFASLNRRLGNAEYISHPADMIYYDRLRVEVLKLAKDHYPAMPPYQVPFAWRQLYGIYVQLKRRPSSLQDAKRREEDRVFAAIEASWNEYVSVRAQMLWLVRKGLAHDETLAYLGLEPDDLGPPVLKDGSRPSNWMDRCDRLCRAVTDLETMTPAEKLAIPQVMATRRAEAATAVLAERISHLEGHVNG